MCFRISRLFSDFENSFLNFKIFRILIFHFYDFWILKFFFRILKIVFSDFNFCFWVKMLLIFAFQRMISLNIESFAFDCFAASKFLSWEVKKFLAQSFCFLNVFKINLIISLQNPLTDLNTASFVGRKI